MDWQETASSTSVLFPLLGWGKPRCCAVLGPGGAASSASAQPHPFGHGSRGTEL